MQGRRAGYVASYTSLCLSRSVWSEFSSSEPFRFRQHQPFTGGPIEHLFQVQYPPVSFEFLGFSIRVSSFSPGSFHEARVPVAFDLHLLPRSIQGVLRSSSRRPLRPMHLSSSKHHSPWPQTTRTVHPRSIRCPSVFPPTKRPSFRTVPVSSVDPRIDVPIRLVHFDGMVSFFLLASEWFDVLNLQGPHLVFFHHKARLSSVFPPCREDSRELMASEPTGLDVWIQLDECVDVGVWIVSSIDSQMHVTCPRSHSCNPSSARHQKVPSRPSSLPACTVEFLLSNREETLREASRSLNRDLRSIDRCES